MNPTKAKLLVVDDYASTRQLIRELMNELGIVSIDEAPDALTALELVQKNQYELVLCDWNLPKVSGLELLRSIRKDPLRGMTPLVLLTDDVTAKSTAEALEAGANGLLQKPFASAQLGEKVLGIINSLTPVSEYRDVA